MNHRIRGKTFRRLALGDRVLSGSAPLGRCPTLTPLPPAWRTAASGLKRSPLARHRLLELGGDPTAAATPRRSLPALRPRKSLALAPIAVPGRLLRVRGDTMPTQG
ncbi:MAG: hypothetical protein WCJ35_28180 [Planctomycetota bacterium]